jgi:hypothetical protein
MADIVSGDAYVDTDNGTDDTSHGTGTGSDACKSFKYLWVSRLGALTGDVTIHCVGVADDPIGNAWVAATKTATYTVTIVGNAASAVWDANKYTWAQTGNDNAVSFHEDHLVIKNIQGYYSNAGSLNHFVRCYTATDGGTIKFAYNYFKAGACGSGTVGLRCSCDINTGNYYIWNCVFDGWSGSGAPAAGGAGLELLGLCHQYIYNCTFVSCNNAIWNLNAHVVVGTNLLFSGNTTDCYEQETTLADTYCATTNDNTKGLTSAGTGNRFSQSFTFTSNYTLDPTDAGAKDYGASDPGAGLFSDDITGTARSGAWDIGASEAAGGATNYIPAIMHFARMRND